MLLECEQTKVRKTIDTVSQRRCHLQVKYSVD